jgi:hypothetical protein
VVNKWDLVAGKIVTEQWAEYAHDTFPGLKYIPIAFVTGLTGKNVRKLINHTQMLFKQAQWRVSTPVLNRLIRQALLAFPPPMIGPRRPRIYFASQVGTTPPMIVIKCSDPDAFPVNYRRYLVGVLRDQLKFGEVPIRVFYEKRDSHSTPRQDRSHLHTASHDADLMDRDLMESNLQDLSPDRMQQWVEAQSQLDRRRSTPRAAEPILDKGPDGAESEEFWDGEQPLVPAGVVDPTDPGSDDFDPEQFDAEAWSKIYEESLVDLPDQDEDDEN